jgi:predicted ATPase/DNA-binding SARP family transcriptional activator
MATEFGILGELQVMQDGAPRDLGSLRQRSLLARLLIRDGQPIATERLIEELWPNDVSGSARHTLHVYISRLRSVLGDERRRLANDASGYRLRVEPEVLDASRFEVLAAKGREALAAADAAAAAGHLREALALWRGPALVEFADEPFASSEATRLDQLRLAAVEDQIDAELKLGLHGQLIEELRTLTLKQPYRETFWEQFMLALYRAGRQADALHAYGEARTRLAVDLGIEPGPALERMEQRVLAHDPTLSIEAPAVASVLIAPVTSPSNLPLLRTTFVGRDRDLAIAGELLVTSRLLTLTGAPGVGKTRMALRLASDHGHRYPDGTFFASLASVSESRQLEPAVVAALEATNACDDPASDGATDTHCLSDRLAGRRLLLVLDNLEQVTGAAGPIDRLLDSAPQLTILVTSRAPLGVIGEQEFPVLPLQVPPADGPADPSTIRAYDAVALLVARARAADPNFEVTPENAAAIAGITNRLDGLPLAIELGAGRLRALTPQSLLDRLKHRLPLLISGTSDTVGRHHTLRGAIAWSYELLTPDQQRLFRRLAPFVGAFAAETAAEVADQPFEETWAGIESLVAQSLLYRPVDVGEARFAMLQTLREFAVEQLELNGELEATLGRHAGFYLGLAERSKEGPSGDRANEAITTLSHELEEIRAALRRCAQGGDRELGLRLAGATWRVWQVAGRITEGHEWLTRLLDPPGPDTTVRAEALVALAGLDYWQADFPAAKEAYEEALELYRTTGDRRGEADVLNGMSMTATWNGDPAEGACLAAQARSLFESLGARAQVGETLMAEGFALWQDREYMAARPLWEDALAISRELGASTLAVTQLAGLGGMEYHTGSRDHATRIALDALGQACDLENVGLCVWLLDFIAAFAVEGQPAMAVRVAGAADALRTASGGGMRVEDLHIEPARAAAARALDPVELEEAWAEGRALSLQEAIDAARSLWPVSIG